VENLLYCVDCKAGKCAHTFAGSGHFYEAKFIYGGFTLCETCVEAEIGAYSDQ
jgi:hypothetical protein